MLLFLSQTVDNSSVQDLEGRGETLFNTNKTFYDTSWRCMKAVNWPCPSSRCRQRRGWKQWASWDSYIHNRTRSWRCRGPRMSHWPCSSGGRQSRPENWTQVVDCWGYSILLKKYSSYIKWKHLYWDWDSHYSQTQLLLLRTPWWSSDCCPTSRVWSRSRSRPQAGRPASALETGAHRLDKEENKQKLEKKHNCMNNELVFSCSWTDWRCDPIRWCSRGCCGAGSGLKEAGLRAGRRSSGRH